MPSAARVPRHGWPGRSGLTKDPDRGQARWQAIWRSRGPKAWALRPLSLLYGGLSWLRRAFYSAGWFEIRRLPVPVIVVGNVVVGGAGKTPTVLALIQHLKAQGWHPGVVSRGYGRSGSDPLEVQTDTPSELSGDEPALIRRQGGVPVVVARQRAQAAKALLAAHPEVDLILCDDGLQHLALGRDLAIAVFDDRGVGNGWLLPAGLLRETWPPRSFPAFAPDLVLQQRSASAPPPDLAPHGTPSFQAQRSLHTEALNATGQRETLQNLAHTRRPLIAMAGIARPQAFFGMLREQGLTLAATVALPDHADAATCLEALERHDGLVLCTEKDAVKLFEAAGSDGERIWAVPLVLNVDPAFFAAVDRHLTHWKSRPSPA
jgi:tetraacyldisaccharide 4'-kinase